MTTVVVDASVAVKWFVKEHDGDAAVRLLTVGVTRVAPSLILLESAAAFSRRVRARDLAPGDARRAISELPRFFSELAGTVALVGSAFELSLDIGHPMPDCFYLALAVAREIKLVTADQAFVQKIELSAHAGRVILLADWAP